MRSTSQPGFPSSPIRFLYCGGSLGSPYPRFSYDGFLALASALIIGGSDFGGGLASRHDNSFRVTAVAQVFGGIMALALALVVGASEVRTADVVAGLVAGLSGTFSFVCFYRALSIGVMSVVAPTTAVVGATIPAVVDLPAVMRFRCRPGSVSS